ncbi:MAG: RnfABCDGE type electron transport complex subunit D [Candidatus Omnitrophica bacterium]|nr:RnfABCDGE type electron transport complex subunit D [Candidatus Omnitrophota bacterium]
MSAEPKPPSAEPVSRDTPRFSIASSPHLLDSSRSTQGMMVDVLIGLAPVLLVSLIVFRSYALLQVGLCVVSCLVFEALCAGMRGRSLPLWDGSAAVTGVILGLSLPWSAPWYIAVIGSAVAIGLAKWVFGGLGYNLFNPAMVGRAFVMLSFAREMGTSAYVRADASLDAVTTATPLAAAKMESVMPDLWLLFVGIHNGSLGETSALACLMGGVYLCIRRTASWEIPAGVILSAAVFAGLASGIGLSPLSWFHHLLSGSLLFGAFFIATDPVSSPLIPKGKWIFGAGVGFFIILIRVFSGYPEGVMFAVLLMNAAVPLINRLTRPVPLGGLPTVKEAVG